MGYLKTICAFAVILCLTPLHSQTVSGQLSVEEVYNLDLVAKEKEGSSERAIAKYFLNMGMIEQSRLASLERTSKGLDAESLLRKELLDELLLPINQMINTGKMDSQTWNQFLSDGTTYRKVFSAIGEDRAVSLVSKSLVKKLTERSTASRKDAYAPVTFLNNEAVMQYLSLNDSQKNELQTLIDESAERIRFGAKEIFTKLETLQKSHWCNLLATLDVKQRSIVKSLVGEPVQWFRNASMDKLKTKEFSLGSRSATTSDLNSIRTGDGRTVYQMSNDELKSHGVELVYGHMLELFQHPFVWDELELSSTQRKKAKETTFKEKTIVVSGQHQNRLDELFSQEVSFPKFISVLSEEQTKWFRQLELQALTNQYESSVSLLHPKMVDHLKLSTAQKNEIGRLSDDYAAEAKKLFVVIGDARNSIKKEFAESVEKILSDEQRALFHRLTGKSSESPTGSTSR